MDVSCIQLISVGNGASNAQLGDFQLLLIARQQGQDGEYIMTAIKGPSWKAVP
jgi:hypothetical protein